MARRAAAMLMVATVVGPVGALIAVRRARAAASDPAGHAAAAAARRDTDIAFYEWRAQADPIGAADRSRLAALYLQRARETGDYGDYRRAETVARRSLALRTAHNTRTYALLASALLAQHRFVEALAVADTLTGRDQGSASARALRGEIELELGRYDAARATFDSLWPARHTLAVAPRIARWAEIVGRPDVARRLLERAAAQAGIRTDLPREQVAWFRWRVGDLALRAGRCDDAAYAFRAALETYPDDYRALAGLARLEAVQHRWRRAIEYGTEAIARMPDPATFGVISDAYAALGDTGRAGDYARAMEIAVRGQPGQWHRAWSLFLLDHGRRTDEVLAHARAELATRRDVYGYDVLAWALHKAGRDAEARVPMAAALAQGTQDPQLFYHAAMIGLDRPPARR